MRAGGILAAGALFLAAVGAVVGGSGAPGGAGPAELAAELESGAALLDPLELARLIRERSPLHLVDVRDSSDFIRFSIPTAGHAALAGLPALADTAGGPIVVYDDGSGRAVRAWLLLRRLGAAEARVLRGGVAGWADEVLNPVLPAGSPEERARFDRVAELSRYFGGLPKVGEPPPPRGGPEAAEAAITLLSRRGCY